jgi:ferredoxin
MTLTDRFVDIFGVWEVARPYLHLFVTPAEMTLVVVIDRQAVTVVQVARLLNIPPDEAGDRLTAAYRRSMLNKRIDPERSPQYTLTDFGHLIDYIAKYDPVWDTIPAETRKAIDQHFLEESLAAYRPGVARKLCGTAPPRDLPNDTVMLLPEVEAMIDAATHIVVQPCDCRRLGQNCSRPIETCIWLNDNALAALDRGHGRRLSAEEAKKLLRWADKKGLMHTADGDWRANGLHEICNCCACDCYPFRGGQALGSKGVWPKSRYLAAFRGDQCTHCGLCVKRCHFNAFYHDGAATATVKGRSLKMVRYNPDLCWGCGLCANTCPAKAIEMEPLEQEKANPDNF